MITYEFTAGQDPLPIFKAKPGTTTDYVEVPLRILIPFTDLRKIDSDRVQDIVEEEIKWAIKNLERRIS